MSSRSSRSSTTSSPLGKRTRQQRDTSPTPTSSSSTLSPRRTPTRSNKSYELSSPSSIEKPSKKIKLNNIKIVASKSTKSVRKGKENIAPGDEEEVESEDDTMDVDIIIKEELLDGRDENFNGTR